MKSTDRMAGPDGGRAAVNVLGPGRAVADLASIPGEIPMTAGALVCADDLPDGLIVADHTGRVVVFNRAATRLTGINAPEALGRNVRHVLPLRDAEGRCWWVATDPYGGLSTRSRHPEVSLYLPDGTEALVTVSYVRAPRFGGSMPGGLMPPGAVERLVITLRGGQQRARVERSRADLVSTVAHELRSPLTSVKGFTATLLAKWNRFTDDQKRVMLETVNADADRVTRLITELLDVSRIESGRMEIHRQLVDIPDRVSKIVAGRVAAGEQADRFRMMVCEDLPETWVDADKVDQILGNLIENALRHGAGTVTVVVEPAESVDPRAPRTPGSASAYPDTVGVPGAAVPAPAVAVSVCDEGDGIAPELVPSIFRQFWRAKRRGGAGLGLYIVKGLVEAHGGTITVQPAAGGGAEFRFTMPAGLPDFG